jgi:hypothetical protein
MGANDDAENLTPRGALRCFASKLAPTVIAANAIIGQNPVGASLLAMDANDDAGNLTPRGALRFFPEQ